MHWFRQQHVLSLCCVALLTAACSARESDLDTFTFTAEEAAEISAIIDQIEGGQTPPEEDETESANGGTQPAGALPEVVVDASQGYRYEHLRTPLGELEDNTLRVTNAFLNVRETASVHAGKLEELKKGDRITLIDFPDANWTHVQLGDGRKGYVSTSYVALLATEQDLPEKKKQFEGLYSVNFQYLNVRAEPSSQSQKLGELSSRQLVRPLSFHGDWARILLEGREGYVATEYLRPFAPAFLVRQERFVLPILRYDGRDSATPDLLVKHLALLREAGRDIITLRDFYELLEAQEEKDVRLRPNAVLLAIANPGKETVEDIADVLRATGVKATLFFRTDAVGPDGIFPGLVQRLAADGHDIQSAGHAGNDLRSLTNTQVSLDIAQSRQIIEDLTRRDVFAIAYPGGGVNDRTAALAQEAGYLFGLTLSPSADGSFDRSQFLKLPATVISESTTEGTLKVLVGIGG